MESLSLSKSQSWLVWFLRGLLVLGMLLLLVRMIDLQVVRGNYYWILSEENRIRKVPILAPRGSVYARGGELLIGNNEVKKAVVFTGANAYQKTKDTNDKPPESLITEHQREYKLGRAFAHVGGYIGEVNETELGQIQGGCPEKGPRQIGSFVGRTGLEEKYDCLLRGIAGEKLIEVNAQGKVVRILGEKEPIPGSDIRTTIDFGLQEFVSAKMDGKKGAIIASTPDGEILALYSSPSYDANIFVNPDKSKEITEALTNPDKPLFNRAISGTFHPGSIYKPIVGLAALEEGSIDKNFKYKDTGEIAISSIYGDFSFKNWYFTQYGGAEGEIDLARAIARSTDTFFYKTGELLGVDKLSEWSEKLGLNKKTEIDIPGEVTGLVPNPTWKLREKGERWFLGNTYHLAIGQGDLAVTPIEIHTALSAISANGKLCPPHIMTSEENKKPCTDLSVNSENLKIIFNGMYQACSAGGTAFTFFDFEEKAKKSVACKTGTAQDEKGDPHAWLFVFAPYDKEEELQKPEIILTVLAENGGEGSRVAGPIAREILDYWYNVPTPTPSVSQTPTQPQ